MGLNFESFSVFFLLILSKYLSHPKYVSDISYRTLQKLKVCRASGNRLSDEFLKTVSETEKNIVICLLQ